VVAFDDAVGAVRSGADPEKAPRDLYAQLTDDERLGLLDGDEPFWPGMPDMMGKGYNLESTTPVGGPAAMSSRCT
jgi:beta-glucosidase